MDTPTTNTMSEDLSGRTMGRYQVLERLGRGGMAEVYRAYQPGLDRYVAIKVIYPHLSDDQALMERFGREARAVAALRHSNIVQVHDFDVQGGVAFMAMEFINGPTLKSAIQSLHQRRRLLPLPVVGQIIGQIADALAYAHEQQIVHRDVKPANVLLRRSAGPGPLDDAAIEALLLHLGPDSVVLTDFGVARIIKDSVEQTATGTLLGSPAYMSPEQGRGERVDPRSDIYSLGVVLYELLTGQVPFDADTPFAVVLKHTTAPLPPPRGLRPDLPEGIERVLLKALAKSPADRYADAAAFGAAVRAQCGAPVGAATLSVAPKPAISDRGAPPPAARMDLDPRATRVVELTTVEAAPPAAPPAPDRPAPAEPRARASWARRALGCLGLLALLAVVAVAAFFAGGVSVFQGLNQAGAITVPTDLAEAATAAALEGNPFPIGTAIATREEPTAAPETVQQALDAALAACGAPGCPGGSASAAVEALDAAVAQHPDSPELLAARAQTYIWWDPYTYADQIRSDLDAALELDDEFAPAYAARGELGTIVAQSDEERAEALDDLNTAIALDPGLPGAYLARARFLSNAPDFYGEVAPAREQVIADASAVLARDPESVEALLLRANAYYNGRLADETLADLDAALALDPANAQALIMRGSTYRYYRNDPATAMAAYDAAIAADEGSLAAREARLSLLIEQGRYDEARADADALVDRDASNPARHAFRGHLLIAIGELEPALADFERALLLGGDELIEARYGRGKARLEQGGAEEAIPDLEATIPQAAELDQLWYAFYQGRRQAYIDLARAYAQAGRGDEAGPVLDQAIEADDGWHLPYLLRARLRREAGDTAGARADLRAALERTRTDAERGEVEEELRGLP